MFFYFLNKSFFIFQKTKNKNIKIKSGLMTKYK